MIIEYLLYVNIRLGIMFILMNRIGFFYCYEYRGGRFVNNYGLMRLLFDCEFEEGGMGV